MNRIGLDGRSPFPLSFSVREDNGSWMVCAAAAQAGELADVLMHVAGDTIVVVNLETNSFLDENDIQWRPSRIAAEQGISCQVHHLGILASGVIGLSEEVIAMHQDDLPQFLNGWSPYELTLVDTPGRPSPERIDEIALATGTAAYNEPVLPSLPGSRLLYHGHDDCYISVESTDRMLPAALLGRLLALLAGSALAGASPVGASPAGVPEPASEIVTSLLGDSAHWIGTLGAVSESTVTLSLSAAAAPWRLSTPLPERVDRTATYDIGQRLWRLAAETGHLPG